MKRRKSGRVPFAHSTTTASTSPAKAAAPSSSPAPTSPRGDVRTSSARIHNTSIQETRFFVLFVGHGALELLLLVVVRLRQCEDPCVMLMVYNDSNEGTKTLCVCRQTKIRRIAWDILYHQHVRSHSSRQMLSPINPMHLSLEQNALHQFGYLIIAGTRHK